jgi:hypothetical protein
MNANNTSYPSLIAQLAELENALYRIGGFCAAYRLLAGELGMEASKPSTEAFWAILEGIDNAATACCAQSDAIRKSIEHGAFK